MAEPVNHDRCRFLGAAAMTIAAAELGMFGVAGGPSGRTDPAAPTPARPVEGELASLGSATAWLNSQPLTADDLRGRVVLIDFWTYTCINWMRSLPYVRAWSERYREHGLVVIGVHTPEFAFEHNLDNVRRAARDMRVEYPIAVDNDQAIWRGFRKLLARPLFRRCAGPASRSFLWRGRLRRVGRDDSAIAHRGRHPRGRS